MARGIAFAGALALICAAAGCGKKMLKADEAAGMRDHPQNVKSADAGFGEKHFEKLQPARKNEPVSVYFAFDSYTIREHEAEKLRGLIGSGKRYTINGHACTIGAEEYNMALSELRARAVRNLIGGGEIRAYGESACGGICKAPEDCGECRRVDVYVE